MAPDMGSEQIARLEFLLGPGLADEHHSRLTLPVGLFRLNIDYRPLHGKLPPRASNEIPGFVRYSACPVGAITAQPSREAG